MPDGSRTAHLIRPKLATTQAMDLTFGIVAGCLLAAAFALLKRRIPEEGDGIEEAP